MSDYKCGHCGTVYAFEEMWDLPERACKHCGYAFHQDRPVWKAYGEIKHHITSLHWLVNKLTHWSAPHRIDIELSTVFLEIAHDWFRGKPNWYETMFFCYRKGKSMECWMQKRYRTEEQAIEGHRRWLKLLENGRYLITYALEKVDGDDPDSKYKFEWHVDFDEKHRRILHGAKVEREMEGTVATLHDSASQLTSGEERRKQNVSRMS